MMTTFGAKRIFWSIKYNQYQEFLNDFRNKKYKGTRLGQAFMDKFAPKRYENFFLSNAVDKKAKKYIEERFIEYQGEE